MMRRRTTRCNGCGLEYVVRYSDQIQVEAVWEAIEAAHRLRAPLCLAGPGSRKLAGDEDDTAPTGGPRPDDGG